ncbi:unnamed protein product, partial [Phaeothamnion confervicola]
LFLKESPPSFLSLFFVLPVRFSANIVAPQGRIPGVLVSHNHSPSPEEYFRELRAAKFCLVFACDDPQTSRFADALAAGCIPIVINDHFRREILL